MTIKLLDPTSHVHKPGQAQEKALSSITRKKIGFVFNQHGTTLALWKVLEKAVEDEYHPAAVAHLYKPSVWAPAPMPDVEKLVAGTDLAIVGIGA